MIVKHFLVDIEKKLFGVVFFLFFDSSFEGDQLFQRHLGYIRHGPFTATLKVFFMIHSQFRCFAHFVNPNLDAQSMQKMGLRVGQTPEAPDLGGQSNLTDGIIYFLAAECQVSRFYFRRF